jgi:hypothetical protein
MKQEDGPARVPRAAHSQPTWREAYRPAGTTAASYDASWQAFLRESNLHDRVRLTGLTVEVLA